MQRSDIHGQDKFENKFYKPMSKNSTINDHLYFKGQQGKAPSRVFAGKNNSSIERVYGLDYDPTGV